MDTAKKAPADFREKLSFVGPGIVLAALAIGSGELVLTPRSGAQYGVALLWVPIVAIIYKAVFSEGLARLTIASGDDVFRAFGWMPGPKHWAQYFIIVIFSLDMIGYGGIALAVGSALVGLFPSIDIRVAAFCTAALVPVILYTGSYKLFERVVVVMCVALVAGAVYTLFQIPLPAREMARGLVPTVPEGSVGTIWVSWEIGRAHV